MGFFGKAVKSANAKHNAKLQRDRGTAAHKRGTKTGLTGKQRAELKRRQGK